MEVVKKAIIANVTMMDDHQFKYGVIKKVCDSTWCKVEKELGIYMVFVGDPVHWMRDIR